MRNSRFPEEQIRLAVQPAEVGVDVTEVSRNYGVRAAAFYRWRQWYGSLSRTAPQILEELQRDSSRLDKLVADLTPDRQILRDVPSRKDCVPHAAGSMSAAWSSTRESASERRAGPRACQDAPLATGARRGRRGPSASGCGSRP